MPDRRGRRDGGGWTCRGLAARYRCGDVDELEELTQGIGAVFADQPIAFSYVFGSVARGVAGADSDVDVAVHFESGLPAGERFDRKLRIGVELERALGREVDLVDLEDAPLRLVGRILTERVVVTGLHRPERVRFENESFRRSVDFEHHARRLDAEILAATAAGRR